MATWTNPPWSYFLLNNNTVDMGFDCRHYVVCATQPLKHIQIYSPNLTLKASRQIQLRRLNCICTLSN